MNIQEVFEDYSTENLRKRKRLSDMALYAVWIGGSIGILAALSGLISGGGVESTTLVCSVLALLASIPVYFERRKIAGIMAERKN
jgi:hypothetical protein